MMIRTLVLLLSVMVVCIVATPAPFPADLSRRQKSQDFVSIVNANEYCMILPRKISESPSGVPVILGNKTFCTPGVSTSKPHGKLPTDVWGYRVFKKGKKNGYRFVQFTGCMKPGLPPPFNDLNVLFPKVAPNVRFDSTRGGHPPGSTCLGYKNYVEVLNPNNNGQACIRCCDDPRGCSDSAGEECTGVVLGAYCS